MKFFEELAQKYEKRLARITSKMASSLRPLNTKRGIHTVAYYMSAAENVRKLGQ